MVSLDRLVLSTKESLRQQHTNETSVFSRPLLPSSSSTTSNSSRFHPPTVYKRGYKGVTGVTQDKREVAFSHWVYNAILDSTVFISIMIRRTNF
jgi:hypothetical protein